MTAARFATKEQAAEVAKRFPLAGAVFVPPVAAKVEGVMPGWYVGFPRNISTRFISKEELEPTA